MTFSISKLQSFLSSNNLACMRYFTVDKYVVYIEILNVKTSDTFLLYVPSKYDFKAPKIHSVYRMREIDTKHKKYGESPDAQEMGNLYDIDINIQESSRMEEELEKNYKRSLKLRTNSNETDASLRATLRQIKRLLYSVENLKYKVGIFLKNYLCVIKRDNRIACYELRKFPASKQKRLYVIIDLETLLNKYDTLTENIASVREAIYHILEKNEKRHIELLLLLQAQLGLNGVSDRLSVKKQNYDELLRRCQNMYAYLTQEEKRVTHSENQTDKLRLPEISKLKSETIKNCIILREKLEHVLLYIDKIMFDNTVMLDSVLKNFSILKSFS